jgi:hypothetical protein
MEKATRTVVPLGSVSVPCHVPTIVGVLAWAWRTRPARVTQRPAAAIRLREKMVRTQFMAFSMVDTLAC